MGFWTDGENDRDWADQCHGEPGAAAEDFMETCSHPVHWRDAHCGCRLCGARPETITKQARQRAIQPPLPTTKSA